MVGGLTQPIFFIFAVCSFAHLETRHVSLDTLDRCFKILTSTHSLNSGSLSPSDAVATLSRDRPAMAPTSHRSGLP